MKVENVFILSAGEGTRMGNVGKSLPKPLWPLFHKSLLEFQAEYVNDIFDVDIYANIFHLKNMIINKNIKNLNLVNEPVLQGSGGSFTFLKENKKIKDNSILLSLNVDHVILINEDMVEKAIKLLNCSDVVLFVYKTNKRLKNNRTLIDENMNLTGIEVFDEEAFPSEYLTYTGMSLMNTSIIGLHNGPAGFFTDIADCKKIKVSTLDISELETWDFGTSNIYYNNIVKILNDFKNNHPLKYKLTEILESKNIICKKNITSTGYCFDDFEVKISGNENNSFSSIIINKSNSVPCKMKGVYYKEAYSAVE